MTEHGEGMTILSLTVAVVEGYKPPCNNVILIPDHLPWVIGYLVADLLVTALSTIYPYSTRSLS